MSIKSIILLLSLLNSAGVSAKDLSGTWTGELNMAPSKNMRVVFHITPDSVTLDSPDQNAYSIGGELVFLSPDSLNVSVSRLQMNYSGKLIGDSIVGQFRQGFFSVPMNLSRGLKKLNRPQTPNPPFPYQIETVSIKAPDATLAGTLTIPENASDSTPVVVLVSGSGLQNRDEEIFEHKPFAVIADYLARNGIASLRYDDRGYGESKGEYQNATTADFAVDAKAVVDYLRKSGRFAKVGLIGHSEGGMIAYMLGAEPETLDFLVSIAGPSVSGLDINSYQNKVALINSGVDTSVADMFATALLKANQYRLNNPPVKTVSEELLQEIYPQFDESQVTLRLSETISATLSMDKIQPWMEYFLKSDPTLTMKKIKIPTLMIFGEKDCQVSALLNLEPAQTNVPHAKVKSYPDLNHLMQHAITGSIEEYKEIEETISTEVLEDIVSFIRTTLI